MKIRIKTLEELGGVIPKYWAPDMEALCGKEFEAKDELDDAFLIEDCLIMKEDTVALEENIIERILELKVINDLHVSYREKELPVIFGDVSIWKQTLEKLFGGYPQIIKLSIKHELLNVGEQDEK